MVTYPFVVEILALLFSDHLLLVWKILWITKSSVLYTDFQMLISTLLDHLLELHSQRRLLVWGI